MFFIRKEQKCKLISQTALKIGVFFLQNCFLIVRYQCDNTPRNNRHLAIGLVLRKQGFSQDQTSTGYYTALLFLVKAVQYFDYPPDKFPALNQKTFYRSISHRPCLHRHTLWLSNLNSIFKHTAFCCDGIPFILLSAVT